MEWFEPLIIIACILFVGGVIFLHFYLKRKGKSLGGSCCNTSSCGGNCKACQEMMNKRKEELINNYHCSCKNK